MNDAKHGHWVRIKDSLTDKAICSVCGKGRADVWVGSSINYRINREDANFCYVCGAIMDEKENGKK